MKIKIAIVVLIVVMQFQCRLNSQSNRIVTELRSKEVVHIGENRIIESQFTDFPLVEPHISVHPRDNNHLFAAAIVITDIDRPYESGRLSSFISRDAGVTWTETVHNWWNYDPWTAILPNGETVMSWIGTFGGFKDQYPVQLFFSPDGGISWNNKNQTLQGSYDGTKITAGKDEFYFTTVRFREDMGADIILYRKKGMELFKEIAKVDGKGTRLNFCEPALFRNGNVLVTAVESRGSITVQIYNPLTENLSSPVIVTTNSAGLKGYMRVVVDTSISSPFKDRAYLVRAVGSSNKYDGVWLNYSTDQGRTWTTDLRVDQFQLSGESRAMVPSLAINSKGYLIVTWVDSRHDSDKKKNDVYLSVSWDGGQNFQQPVRVTSVSSDPNTRANGDVANKFPAGGHYLNAIAKPDDSFQLIWSDSRNGIFQLQTCNVIITN